MSVLRPFITALKAVKPVVQAWTQYNHWGTKTFAQTATVVRPID
jgi:hypothetical protein